MSATGIGAPVRRKEDQRFITGKGQYTDDINRPGQAYAVFVRSPTPTPTSSASTPPLRRNRQVVTPSTPAPISLRTRSVA